MDRKVEYNINSHVFDSYIKTGKFDPYVDTIIYDGGDLGAEDLEDRLLEEIVEEDGE